MNRSCFCLLCFLLLTSLGHSQENNDTRAIRQILSDQVAAWNNGNIEGYMKGYWENDSLLFVGKKGPTYGYKTTLENYRNSYPGPAAMGKLQLDVLKMQSLSPNSYFILGKWMLTRSIGDLDGYFTLLLRKISGRWVIVADHSS